MHDDADAARLKVEVLRTRLIEMCAAWCARSGFRRIALFGAGRHSEPLTHQPWARYGIAVDAILDDSPRVRCLGGVAVHRASDYSGTVDAIVVSSEVHEDRLALRAHEIFGSRGVPIVRIYQDPPAAERPL